MRLNLSDIRLQRIVKHTQRRLPDVSQEQIEDFIDGGEEGWECGDEEQQEWLDNSTSIAIASWVIAGLR